MAPIVLLQAIVTYVFFERDLDATTRRMARDVAADVALLVALEDSYPAEGTRRTCARWRRSELRYRHHVSSRPENSAACEARTRRSTIDEALDDIIAQQIGEVRHFQTTGAGNDFDIRVEVHDGVLRMIVPRDRVTVSAPDIFILWMVGSALILMAVAILFLRNQVRPIERLARAADAFGKGRAVPDFKPYGATEVRRAAQAFLTMRERIERYLQQRTEMLAGVSHDLKTPLTRMKLALAMMPASADIDAMRGDIVEMEHMLDEYLDFARGEGGEQSELCDLADAGARRRERGGARAHGGAQPPCARRAGASRSSASRGGAAAAASPT